MCGFFAVVGPRGTLPSDASAQAALDTLALRGPDGEGLLRLPLGEDRELLMGHRRLAIVGLQDGAQPLRSGAAAAVVNGEFYGFEEVRLRLRSQGVSFRTSSDSEILLGLHEVHQGRRDADGGPSAWTRDLCGEFAFALAEADGTLWAACDPAGTKPLRWWRSPDGRTVMVASDAKTLFALGVPRELDEEALRFALALQYLPYGKTLFRGVGMVPPGGWLRAGEGDLAQGVGWNHFTQEPITRHGREPEAAMEAFPWLSSRERDLAAVALNGRASRASKAAALRALLEGAVARRLPQERNFATHLSGGIDSAIVTALAVRLTGASVDGYCASFPWAGQGDETQAAADTARAIGARMVPVAMSPAQLLEAMDEAPLRSEGLSINLHAGAKILVADAIRRDGYRVAFTGEGADEAFLGYEHLRFDIPEDHRPQSADVNPASIGIMRPDAAPRGDLGALAALLQGEVPSWIRTKAAAADLLTPTLGERLRSTPFDAARLASDLPQVMLASASKVDAVARARGLWSIYCLSGYILRGLDDAMGMARGVESRLAFLDPALQWFAARLRAAEHYGADGIEKGLLRDAVADLLPEEVLRRPKRAFLAPSVMDQDLGRDWARDRLLAGSLTTSGLFSQAGLEALLDSPSRPVRDAGILTLASLSRIMSEAS